MLVGAGQEGMDTRDWAWAGCRRADGPPSGEPEGALVPQSSSSCMHGQTLSLLIREMIGGKLDLVSPKKKRCSSQWRISI